MQARLDFDFRAVRQRFIDIYVLPFAKAGIEIEVDLITKQVVEVSRRQRIITAQPLLESGPEGAGFFRP